MFLCISLLFLQFSYDEPTDAGDSNNASIQETALQEVQTSGQSSIVPSQELTQSNRWIQTDTVPTEESVEMMGEFSL